MHYFSTAHSLLISSVMGEQWVSNAIKEELIFLKILLDKYEQRFFKDFM